MSLLKSRKVRITCRKNYETQPLVIIRGLILDQDSAGISVRGRTVSTDGNRRKKGRKTGRYRDEILLSAVSSHKVYRDD